MYSSGLKSKVIENQIPFRSMRCSKDSSDSDSMAAIPTGAGPLWTCLDGDNDDVAQTPRTCVVIVEPRQTRFKSASSSTSNRISRNTGNGIGNDNGYFGGRFGGNISRPIHPPPERFILPQSVDANSDLRRLANSVSAVMTISFELLFHEHTLQRPGCEEGLRSISDYAHQIFTTLLQTLQPTPDLQPLALSSSRSTSLHMHRRASSLSLLDPQPSGQTADQRMSGFFDGRSGSTSSSSRHPAELFMLPQPDLANSDLMCLVARLTTMIIILIRLNAPQHTREHPEREEGMRQMLHYAHQMFNTLLQPPPMPPDRPGSSNRSCLLHLLYEQASVPTPSRAEGRSGYFGGHFEDTSSPPGHPPEVFMLPEAVDVHTDLRSLVNSLMAVAIILTGLRAQDQTRQHPEREEGLRIMLHYIHEMFATLLQPLPFPAFQPTNLRLPSISLLENIYDPMQDPMPERSSATEGMPGGGDNDSTHHSSSHPLERIGLPPVDVNSDVMSLVNSLMITVIILIRVNAPEYTRQHPEREEDMRQMLHCAHQMFNTLLQPPPMSLGQPMSSNTDSLLRLLYEQMSVPPPNRAEAAEEMAA